MKLRTISAWVLIFALSCVAHAFAQIRPQTLADSKTPGSVIVFPKFINRAPVSVDGAVLPRTEIEIGVVCPTNTACTEHQPVKIRFHWVCPGAQLLDTLFVCPETDFDVVLSVNGKLAFSADGTSMNSNSPRVPQPKCPNGYLIGWVIDTIDQPIKFDGLIGNAVLRGPALIAGPNAGSSAAVTGYSATTIQADPALSTNDPIATEIDPATGTSSLAFDGAPAHYQAVTGVLYGHVKFDRMVPGGDPAPSNALNETWLILLTLNVRSNLPNFPTFAPLEFYNESSVSLNGDPAFARLTSGSTEFLCWTQVQLSDIHPDLNQVSQGTRKGQVIAGPTIKVPFLGIFDTPGPVTLLGFVQLIEGAPANGFYERSYIHGMFNDGVPVSTRFLPFPF